MAKKIGTATVFITGDLSGLNKTLGQAQAMTQKAIGNIQSSMQTIGAGLTAMGAGLGAAIGGIVLQWESLGSTINDMAAKTGFGTRALSELTGAAQMSGADIGDLANAMKGLNRALAGMEPDAEEAAKDIADLGSKYNEAVVDGWNLSAQLDEARRKMDAMRSSGKANNNQIAVQAAKIQRLTLALQKNNMQQRTLNQALKDGGGTTDKVTKLLERLGLTFDQVRNAKPEDQFLMLARRIADVQDPTEKAQIATALFGRSAQSLMPLMAEGSAGIDQMIESARRMGFSFDADMIAKADKFGDTLTLLKLGLQAAAMEIGTALAPQLQSLAEWFRDFIAGAVDWIKGNEEFVAGLAKITGVVAALGITLGPVVIAFGSLLGILSNIIGVIQMLQTTALARIFLEWGTSLKMLTAQFALIAAAGAIGWQLGRLIDHLTAKTKFGEMIDSWADSVSILYDKFLAFFGLLDTNAGKLNMANATVQKVGGQNVQDSAANSIQPYAHGGIVHAARGLQIRGFGGKTADNIPAMVSAGEIILPNAGVTPAPGVVDAAIARLAGFVMRGGGGESGGLRNVTFAPVMNMAFHSQGEITSQGAARVFNEAAREFIRSGALA